jgi:hypothetical protein
MASQSLKNALKQAGSKWLPAPSRISGPVAGDPAALIRHYGQSRSTRLT